MTNDQMQILKDIKSEVNLISVNIKKICRELKIGVVVRQTKPEYEEYDEKEIPDMDELDRRELKNVREIIKEIY